MSIFALRSNSLASSAYKNLSRTQGSLNDNISRLASGLRINKAADDSAGSAISTRMNSQITGMKQANRNAQDVNNLIQTTEGGLNDISGILNRMRELAVQAATDTLNNSDRASIDLEYQALKNEITRIANATQYNEMDILNGGNDVLSGLRQNITNAEQAVEAAQTAKSEAESWLSQAKTTLTNAQEVIIEPLTLAKLKTSFSQAQTMFDDAIQTFENATGIVTSYEDLENIAPLTELETDGQDMAVTNINDENFGTRWNAKNDDVDAWIKFSWESNQKINRVHLTEAWDRISEHTVEYSEIVDFMTQSSCI